MKTLFATFAVLFHLSVVGQVQRIDSLRGVLNEHPDADTLRAILLSDLAVVYQQVNPDTALWYGNQALALSEKLNFTRGKAWALNRISGAYWMKAKYPDALRYSLQALGLFEQLNDKNGLAQSYNSVANTYNIEKDHQNALLFYEKSISMYSALGNNELVMRGRANIGRTYFMLNDYPKALQYLEKVILDMGENQNSVLFAIVLNTSGDVYQAMGELDDALRFYMRALAIIEKLKVLRVITYSTRGISEVFQKNGKLKESNFYALRTLEISKTISYIENVKNAALILSDNYRILGEYNKAYDYYVEYGIAKDSMFSLEKEKVIQKMENSFELTQKEQEIEKLKTEKELEKANSLKRDILIISLFVIILLSGGFVYVLFRNNKIIQKSNKLLLKQRNQLATQNIEITQQREEIVLQSEKLKEANELKNRLFSVVAHDLRSPFQSLMMVTEYLDKDLYTQEELTMLKGQLLTNIRALSEMLNTILLWANNQIQGEAMHRKLFAINDLIQRNLKVFEIPASGKNIHLEFDAKETLMAFADVDHVDSIVRNLINNAIKFTKQDGSILAKISQKNSFILVSVQDTGVGIPPEKINVLFDKKSRSSTSGTAQERGSGFGLLLTKDLVESNGGEIWVESEMDKGSIFYFTIPLSQDEAKKSA